MTSYIYLLLNWESPKFACAVKGYLKVTQYLMNGPSQLVLPNQKCVILMMPFEITEGKKENAGNQQSSFPTKFSTLHKRNLKFSVSFILSSANAFNLDQFKILSIGITLKMVGQ